MTVIELREKLIKHKLGVNILCQAADVTELYSDKELDKEIDFKILVNGKEIKNPFEYMENINKAIDAFLDNIDKEVDKCAMNIVKEKYGDLYTKSFDLTRKLEELQSNVEWEMEGR